MMVISDSWLWARVISDRSLGIMMTSDWSMWTMAISDWSFEIMVISHWWPWTMVISDWSLNGNIGDMQMILGNNVNHRKRR